MNFALRTVVTCMLAVLAATATAAPAATTSYVRSGTRAAPPIVIQSTTFESSCTDQALAALKKQMFGEKFQRSQELWKLVQIVLCGDPSAANVRTIRNALAASLSTLQEGTAQDSVRETLNKRDIDVRNYFFRQGVAYDASVSRDGKDANLNYQPDEACSEGPHFNLMGNRWRIVAYTNACD